MAKKIYTWKDWWKEIFKGLPLLSTIFIAYFAIGFWMAIIIAIIALYVGNLYDRIWQEKIHSSFSTFGKRKEHNYR